MTWPIRQERRGTREAHSNPTGAVCSLSRLPPTRSRIILIRSVDFITALLHLYVCRFHWPAMAQRLVPRRESGGCARSWSIRVDSHLCAGRPRRRSILSLRPSREAVSAYVHRDDVMTMQELLVAGINRTKTNLPPLP